jgi:hypothetical protein
MSDSSTRLARKIADGTAVQDEAALANRLMHIQAVTGGPY